MQYCQAVLAPGTSLSPILAPYYCLSGARKHLSITQLPPLDHWPVRLTESSVHEDVKLRFSHQFRLIFRRL